MCGIFGAIDFSGFFTDDDFNRFKKLTDLVSYRGPDASGYILLDSRGNVKDNEGHFNIFLGQ